MVLGLPHTEHADELCDSCLVRKQRRLSFHKVAKCHARDMLELIRGDLHGPLALAMHGRRRFSCYMWLQLLMREQKSRKQLRVLWTNSSGEFTSMEFTTYYVDQSMARHLSMPFTVVEWSRGATKPNGGGHGT